MGLGSAADVALAEAREKAKGARQQVKAGVNPIEERRAYSAPQAVASDTFQAFALSMIDKWESGWKPAADGRQKQRDNWIRTVKVYCKPIANKPVDQVTTDDVVRVLKPLWNDKQETANKARRRIEKFLAAAKVAGLRSGENPARWKDHLELMMPAVQVVVEHHPAMPYPELPKFMAELRAKDTLSARALEFLILTVGRTTQVCYAEKAEIYPMRLWIIPPNRMKGRANRKKEHRVPLSDRALEIARQCAAVTSERNPYIFGSPYHPKALSTAAMDSMLEDMGYAHYTVHGFRSSFRDWAGNKTAFDRETIEFTMAHIVGNTAEQAYRREDSLEKRRVLMHDWAAYLAAPT